MSLEGLSGVRHIGGELSLLENGALRSTRALEALRSVGISFVAMHNPNLEDLEALSGLTEVRGDLSLVGLPKARPTAALASSPAFAPPPAALARYIARRSLGLHARCRRHPPISLPALSMSECTALTHGRRPPHLPPPNPHTPARRSAR